MTSKPNDVRVSHELLERMRQRLIALNQIADFGPELFELLNRSSKPAGSDQEPPLEIPSRTITLSGCKFTEDELLRRAVRAVHGNRRNTYPRWALVRDAFGCGSGVSTALCHRFGFDPEEILKS